MRKLTCGGCGESDIASERLGADEPGWRRFTCNNCGWVWEWQLGAGDDLVVLAGRAVQRTWVVARQDIVWMQWTLGIHCNEPHGDDKHQMDLWQILELRLETEMPGFLGARESACRVLSEMAETLGVNGCSHAAVAVDALRKRWLGDIEVGTGDLRGFAVVQPGGAGGGKTE